MADTETVKQETTAEPITERTFTQSELNAIIEGRLKKEREKFADYEAIKDKAARFDEIEEASKTELQKATEKAKALQAKIDEMTKANEVAAIRTKIASETGVPANLLTGDSEESCKAQAEAIMAFAKPSAYPSVKDGGEVNVTHKKTEQEQFAEWFGASLAN